MTYTVKKQMVKMAVQVGEIMIFEVAVPFIKDFAENKIYPTACEKWDEFVARKLRIRMIKLLSLIRDMLDDRKDAVFMHAFKFYKINP